MSKILRITTNPNISIGEIEIIRCGEIKSFRDAVGHLTLLHQTLKSMCEDTILLYEDVDLSVLTSHEISLLREIRTALMSEGFEDIEIRSEILF